MLIGWDVLSSLCLILLGLLWVRLWMYWWIRGVPTSGLPPPIGCLLPVWTGRLTIPGLTQAVFKKYPTSPVVGSWILGKPVLMIKDPKLVHQILSEDFSVWPDRGFSDNPSLDPLSQHLINLAGKKWKLVRAWMSSGYGLVGLKARYGILIQEADSLVRCMLYSPDKIDTLKSTRKMTLTVLSRFVLSLPESPASIKSLIDDAFKGSLWTTLRSAARLTCPDILTSIGCKRFSSAQEIAFINLVNDRLHQSHVKANDMLQILIDAYKGYKASYPHSDDINENLLASNAFGALAAGYDTVANTLAWGFFELAKHPQIQEKIHLEIHKVLALHGELCYNALADMLYLDNVISEILRLYPVVTMTSRVSSSFTKLGDLKIPVGLRVLIPIYSIHRDPANFPDPDRFDPERYTKDDIPRVAHMPFGKGLRICQGWRLALMTMKTSFITILKDFKLSVAAETKQPMEIATNSLFLTPKYPIYLKLHQRD